LQIQFTGFTRLFPHTSQILNLGTIIADNEWSDKFVLLLSREQAARVILCGISLSTPHSALGKFFIS
jgi:hypothetical protein